MKTKKKNTKPITNRTAIGVRAKDGIVLGVEKLILSKMLEEGSNRRVFSIDRHIGMVKMQIILIIYQSTISF